MSDLGVTCWFPIDPHSIKGNPLKIETPYGVAQQVSIGNEFERADALEARAEVLRAERDVMRGVVEAAAGVEFMFRRDGECSTEHFDRKAMRFYRETGLWPPGKSMPMELNAERATMKQFTDWQGEKIATLCAELDALALLRAALKAQQE